MRRRHMIMFFLLVVECLSLTVRAWSQTEGRPCVGSIMPIAYGDLITCNAWSGTVIYRFSGKVGEVIHVHLSGANGKLLDPDGWVLPFNRKLDKTGTYTLEITPIDMTPGLYTLCLERIVPPSPSMPTLRFGQTLDNELNPGGDVDYYTFSGYAGDTITIRIENLIGSDQDEILYDPTGVQIATGSSFASGPKWDLPYRDISIKLSQDGQYVVGISGFFDHAGSYRLTSQCSGRCEETNTFFPQIVVGGGYSTLFVITNTGATASSGNLILKDQQGSPMSVSAQLTDSSGITLPASSGSAFALRIPSGGTVFLSAAGLSADDPVKTGWGQLESTSGSFSAVATYEYVVGTTIKSMLGVIPSQPLQYSTILVDNDNSQGKQIAYAIANPSGQNIVVKLALLGQDGAVVDDTVTITLGPGQQIARYVWQDLARRDFKGSLVLRGQNGATFVAVALADKQGFLTVVPVISGKVVNLPN